MTEGRPIRVRSFELAPWQRGAVEAWARGDQRGHYRGTLEVVTGGGKTLIALACAARASETSPDLRLAIVVPTEALARQWRMAVENYTDVDADDIGILGAGGSATLEHRRILIAVINSAARHLPSMAASVQPLMLVVDECHRAGAPSFSRVLRTPAAYRLGLSATPEREELDENGEPLLYDEQLVGRALGAVVYSFTLRDARTSGWLPDYDIHHHGVELMMGERSEYDAISRRIDDLMDELRSLGVDSSRAQQLQTRADDVGRLARRYVAMTSQRKDLLYRADQRNRATMQIVRRALSSSGPRRVLLFHERVREAVSLHARLQQELPATAIALEHSRLGVRDRVRAMDDFRKGRAQVLVSVKSLVEGIDVPEADVGVSVASTSSVRQRIQSLGRVLRRQFDESAVRKHAEMHLLYVSDTVDELIYAKEDWSDLTGHGANHYWRWRLAEAGEPYEVDGPPASPRPTEEQEWERLARSAPDSPVPWLGGIIGQEYSVDTLGTVTNQFGRVILNAQGVGQMVERVRERSGGRFRVTPAHRLVLVFKESADGPRPFVTGQLSEPFEAESDDDLVPPAPESMLQLAPGDLIASRPDKTGGTFRLRQKQGGVIERSAPDGATEYALTSGSGDPVREANAGAVLEAWRGLFPRGITFHVSKDGNAWYLEGGKRRFLAEVPGGFAWPSNGREA